MLWVSPRWSWGDTVIGFHHNAPPDDLVAGIAGDDLDDREDIPEGQLRVALTAQPVTAESLPPEITRDWLLPDGRARPQVVPKPATPSQVSALLDQIDSSIASFVGDGAYDQEAVYTDVTVRHPEARVVVPLRATAVLSSVSQSAPTQRDRHLQAIAGNGRMQACRAAS